MPSLVMRRFIDRLTVLSELTSAPHQLAIGAGTMLESVLGFEHVLDASEAEPDPDHYRQHILHIDPAGRFSVVALVWLPGHETPIHDHVAWCVAGVLTGREREHRYERLAAPCGPTTLRTGPTVLNETGEVSVLTAGPDIHQVTCASGGKTISIHVYGADITRKGTSIQLTYDPQLVVLDAADRTTSKV
ncbi:MAG TPA: cysteine dioxygenase family protein [Pseudonocardiaceae bacterium]|nr:cysteine dioxygenase family protein [Pseudonocardiaceae bacterium]